MKPLTILIVDDLPINLKLLRAQLEGEGHTVLEGANGAEGLTMLDSETVDVIVSDILMPVMDGYRFCYEVRHSERHHQLPFIIYTSTYVSPSDEKLSLDMGADRYLLKPAPIDELVRTIADALSSPRRQPAVLLESTDVLKRYNSGLVTKLEKKNAELSIALNQLHESERQFREMLDNLDLISVMVDREARVTYCNDYFLQLTGWKREEVIGSNWFERFAPPELAGERKKAFSALLADGTETRHYRTEILARSGERRLIQWNNSLTYSPSGEVIGAASIAEDITDRVRMEAQLLRNQRLESLGTLAGGIAHDLNNLLLPILMGVTLLRRFDPNETSLKAIENIERSVRRGRELVKQVLLFARGGDTARQVVLLGDIVREIQAIVESTFPRDITFEVAMAGDAHPVMGDATQLVQVLLNLCVNARDAMPRGGLISLSFYNSEVTDRDVRIHGGVAGGSYVVMEVTDTGEGISEQIIDRIFDPFFTTKELGEGTGLGLSTVRGIVIGHGGFITVSSVPGEGSTFTVHLPAHGPSPETIAARGEAGATPQGHGELILVVDDDAGVVAMTKQTLEVFGYEVETAEDGAQAIGLFSRRQSDIALVLTDMAMPIIDGPALIAALHRMSPDVRIIATTGNQSPTQMAKIMKTGVTHVLLKPYTAGHLLRRVAEVLKKDAD